MPMQQPLFHRTQAARNSMLLLPPLQQQQPGPLPQLQMQQHALAPGRRNQEAQPHLQLLQQQA